MRTQDMEVTVTPEGMIEAIKLTQEMIASGISFRAQNAEDLALRAKVLARALAVDRIPYAEASAAVVALARRRGEDRVINATAGDIAEEVFAARRSARVSMKALPPATCNACDGTGWEMVKRGDVERARRCACRPGAGAAA